MNKALVLGLAVLGLGGVYMFMNKKASSTAGSGPKLASGPVNSISTAPRVDNQSQPWYHNSMNFLQTQLGDWSKKPLTLEQGGSVIHSLSDIWGNVSGFFDGPDTTPAADSPGEFTEELLPGSSIDQSNLIGQQISNMNSDWNEDPSFTTSDPSNEVALIDPQWSDNYAANYGADMELETA